MGTASSDFVVVRYEGIPPEIDLQQPAGTSIASGSGKSFGSVTVGGSAELTFTIANTGSRDLNLTGSPDKVAVSGTDASLYTVTAQPNSPVTPGNTSPFTVRFAPTSGGSKSAMLMIASEDVDEGIYTIHVSGSDTTPPETMITSTQPTPTGRTNATITFTGSDDVTPGVSITYEGRLDSAAFGAVASPITLNDLADGSHTYQVRAKDASGNVDPTPASVTWVVDTTIPLPGNLDLAFGTRGKAITDIGGNTDIGQSVAVQSDGKIVVAGYSYVAGTTGDFALVRYTTSGALDSSFGTGGQVITHIGNGCLGYSAAVQSDGKIVVAGYAWIGGYPDIALARYLPSGALDTTFGTGGKVTTSLGNPFDKGQSVA